MANKSKTLRGNGNINVSNVNSKNSECVTLTYTMRNIRSERQLVEIKNTIYNAIDDPITFDRETKNWDEDNEELILKVKIKACDNEKKAHGFKKILDGIVQIKGGQTTLDEAIGAEE